MSNGHAERTQQHTSGRNVEQSGRTRRSATAPGKRLLNSPRNREDSSSTNRQPIPQAKRNNGVARLGRVEAPARKSAAGRITEPMMAAALLGVSPPDMQRQSESAARTDGTLDSIRSLTDDELLGEHDALREHLATENDPAARKGLQISYHNAQWIAHERGIESHEDWVRNIDIAQNECSVPEDAGDMRAFIEQHIAKFGRFWGTFKVQCALQADDATEKQRTLGEEQVQEVLAEADAVEKQFTIKAMTTAWTLLNQSSRQIGGVLAEYGLSLSVDDLVLQLARDEADVDTVAEQLLARSKRDISRASGCYESKAEERAQLAAVAQEMRAQKQHLHSL